MFPFFVFYLCIQYRPAFSSGVTLLVGAALANSRRPVCLVQAFVTLIAVAVLLSVPIASAFYRILKEDLNKV